MNNTNIFFCCFFLGMDQYLLATDLHRAQQYHIPLMFFKFILFSSSFNLRGILCSSRSQGSRIRKQKNWPSQKFPSMLSWLRNEYNDGKNWKFYYTSKIFYQNQCLLRNWNATNSFFFLAFKKQRHSDKIAICGSFMYTQEVFFFLAKSVSFCFTSKCLQENLNTPLSIWGLLNLHPNKPASSSRETWLPDLHQTPRCLTGWSSGEGKIYQKLYAAQPMWQSVKEE